VTELRTDDGVGSHSFIAAFFGDAVATFDARVSLDRGLVLRVAVVTRAYWVTPRAFTFEPPMVNAVGTQRSSIEPRLSGPTACGNTTTGP
jgi:hypothetical protein